MSEHEFEPEDELDCEVTVFDGAHMTCDMVEEEFTEKKETHKDSDP